MFTTTRDSTHKNKQRALFQAEFDLRHMLLQDDQETHPAGPSLPQSVPLVLRFRQGSLKNGLETKSSKSYRKCNLASNILSTYLKNSNNNMNPIIHVQISSKSNLEQKQYVTPWQLEAIRNEVTDTSKNLTICPGRTFNEQHSPFSALS